MTNKLSAQCPDIQTTLISPTCNNCFVCPGAQFTFNVTGQNLPDGGTIDWYTGTTPGFNPYNGQGVFIGSSDISTASSDPCMPCPNILAIFVDACNGSGTEPDNEFIVLSSGNGFNSNNLQIDFASQNNNVPPSTNDINIGASPCGFQTPSAALVNNITNDPSCNGANVVFAGANANIPAGVLVFVFTSANENYDYDFSGICATGQTIYILQSSCARAAGAFSNNSSTGLRPTTVSLSNCPCSNTLTYDTDAPGLTGDGAFVYKDASGTVQYANNGCTAPPVTNVPVPPPPSTVDPFTYTFDDSYCSQTYGGPVYIVGVISPAPTAPCPQEFTTQYSFTMSCPEAEASNNGPICAGEQLQLFAETVPGATYTWTGPNMYSSSQQNPIVSNSATAAMAGVYTLTVTLNGCQDVITTTVVIDPAPTANLTGPTGVCQGENITLSVAFTGTGPWTFNYTIGGVPQTPITTSDNPYLLVLTPGSNTTVALTGVSNAACPGTVMGSVAITVWTLPQIVNVQEVCLTAGTYQVTFTVTGGTPPYTNSGPTGGSFSGANFTSVTIPVNTPYTFTIDDGHMCGPITLSGLLETCPCNNDPGTMSQTLIDACDSSIVTGIFNNDTTLAPGQVLRFILHTNPGTPPGTILATSNTPVFNLASIPGIVYGVTYYISSVVGPLSGGNINYGDPCTKIAEGQPIIVHRIPNVNFNWDWALCLGECEDIQLTFTGEPDFELSLGVQTPPGATVPSTVTVSGASSTFSICAPASDQGNMTFYAYSISNAYCSRTINYQHTVDLNAPSNTNITRTLCAGQSLVVNGVTYDQSNPSGTETMQTAAGCDSVIQVSLSFYPTNVTNLNQTLCFGQSITVNGTVYNQANPSGQEVMVSAAGCDSTININLSFDANAQTLINPTLCDGETIVVEGTTYGQANPQDVIELVGESGCDSIVTIDLSFYPPAVGTYNATLCNGGSVVINGTTYNQAHPSGVETFVNANGCDSTLTVNISFYPAITRLLNPRLCPGEFIVVNGEQYDQSHPTGTETLVADNGCDSVVTINLSFYVVGSSNYNPRVCTGDSLLFNGTYYHAGNLTGTEIFSTANGCDSMVHVTLSFYPSQGSTINQTLCFGQSITVNGTIYDETNPIGVEIMQGSHGCDSTIVINLNFAGFAHTLLTPFVCPSDSIFINGTWYHSGNPTGSTTLPGQSGCDSIVEVELGFYDQDTTHLNPAVCQNGSVVINGITYDAGNPGGFQVLTSLNGCDSVLEIALQFADAITTNINPTICHNDTITIQGVDYYFGNANGRDTLLAANGCDSILVIAVGFFPERTNTLNQTLCPGQSITVNGTVYDENNPAGNEIISDPTGGCDSLVLVNLSFSDTIRVDINRTLCANENLPVGPEVFNINNPKGQVLLKTAAGCDSLISVDLSFHPERRDSIIRTICTTSSITVNGTVYDINNPTGTEVLSFPGQCDSLVYINLNFADSSVNELDTLVCSNDLPIVIEGQSFDASNPIGSIRIPNGSADGCDSVIHVNLLVQTEAIFESGPITCRGADDGLLTFKWGSPVVQSGTISINGNPYTFTSLPFTLPVLVPGINIIEVDAATSARFCMPQDSAHIWVEDGPALDTTLIQSALCTGQSLSINGTVYNAANPSGFEILSSAQGCDSVLNVQLSFTDTVFTALEQTLCKGQNLQVGTEIFDAGNPSGEVFLQSAAGCDSVVLVNLQFVDTAKTQISQILCSDEQVTVGTEIFDINRPQGSVELLTDAGCDSLVNVSLSFYPEASSTINSTLCSGSSITVNGTVYDENNPAGVEILSTANGCDSTVTISLIFGNQSVYHYTTSICSYDSVVIEGEVFHFDHPSGQILLEGAAAGGCDSLINVDLTFKWDAIVSYKQPECPGGKGSITLDGPPNPMFDGVLMLNKTPYPFVQFPFTVDNLDPGSYLVSMAAVSEVCIPVELVQIEEPDAASLQLSIDSTLVKNSTFRLKAQSNIEDPAQIIWTPANVLSCADCMLPTATIDETTTFYLTLISESGCQVTDSLQIRINSNQNVFVPSGFSPGQDGNNDRFNVYGDPENIRRVVLMRIFNRWGDMIFEGENFPANDANYGWDGSFRSQRLDPAVFVYYIEVEFANGEVQALKGDVTLAH